MLSVAQDRKSANGRIVCDQLTLVEDQQSVRHGDHIFQSVFTNQDGGAQFPVDTSQSLQKVRCRDWVQLAGGFVQNQNVRLQYHNGCQIQKLLLTTGKLRNRSMKPGLDTKETGHFRHSSPDGGSVHPKALQTEGQLMPDLIGDDLAFGVLHHKTDFCGLGAVIHLSQRLAVEKDHTFLFTVGSKDSFELSKHGGFAAPGRACQHCKITGVQLHGNIPENRDFLLRVCKG